MFGKGQYTYDNNGRIIEVANVRMGEDSMIVSYLIDGYHDKGRAHSILEGIGVFAQCNHEHDCCGCYNPAYIADYHHTVLYGKAYTGMSIKFLRNV